MFNPSSVRSYSRFIQPREHGLTRLVSTQDSVDQSDSLRLHIP